jgi:hypothetical protein
MVLCMFSLNLPLFGLESSSKSHGSNLLLPSNRIALFHWTLDLEVSTKVALKFHHWSKDQQDQLSSTGVVKLCMSRVVFTWHSFLHRVRTHAFDVSVHYSSIVPALK